MKLNDTVCVCYHVVVVFVYFDHHVIYIVPYYYYNYTIIIKFYFVAPFLKVQKFYGLTC